jgi:Protein of unknown function (DUF3015)
MKRITVLAIPLLMLVASGCTLKATIKETTDTISNITGTTSGRSWFTEDGLLHPDHKLTAFLTLNQMNVEQDLARGQGEYATSLATLLGLPNNRQAEFHANAQRAFESLLTSNLENRRVQLQMLAR